MGKASRTKVESSRREKIAAQRAAERRAAQRKRIFIASGSIIVVLAIVVVFVVVKLNSSPASDTSSNGPTGAALSSVVSKVTSVPTSVSDAVGSGSGLVTAKPEPITGKAAPLTANGKPEVLYMGAEYCPYCAAERWAIIVALSRFGTFSGLATVHSAAADGAGNAEPFPNTPSFTFVHAKYASQYLTLQTVELNTNIPDKSNGFYTTLQTPTAAQNAVINKWDVPPYTSVKGSIPFVDFGNKTLITGVSYTPGVLAGLSWATIASDLSNPSSQVAKGVLGTANYITAAVCKLTGNQPGSACTPAVKALESGV